MRVRSILLLLMLALAGPAGATVTTTVTFLEYTGTGSQTSFPIPYAFDLTSDITLRLGGTAGQGNGIIQTSGYTVTKATSGAGGTLTITVPPTTGQVVRIERHTPRTQGAHFVPSAAVPPAAAERGLDRLTLMVQEGIPGSPGATGAPGAGLVDIRNAPYNALCDGSDVGPKITQAFGDGVYNVWLPNGCAWQTQLTIPAKRRVVGESALALVTGLVLVEDGGTLETVTYVGKYLGMFRNTTGSARTADAVNVTGALNLYKGHLAGAVDQDVGITISHLGLGDGDNFYAQTDPGGTATNYQQALYRGDLYVTHPNGGRVFDAFLWDVTPPASRALRITDFRTTIDAPMLYQTTSVTTGPIFKIFHSGSAADAGVVGLHMQMATGSGSFAGSFLKFDKNFVQQALLTHDGTLVLKSLSGAGVRCVHADNNGLLSLAAADCGGGGGGGSGNVNAAATLDAGQLVLGAGGTDVAQLGDLGTTTKVLHGNAAGAPTWGAVSLTADVTGVLPLANGGTGVSSAADDTVLVSNGTTWQAKVLTTCTGAGKAVTYDATTNTFGCNTIAGGGGSGAAGADGSVQFATAGLLNADPNLFWLNASKFLGVRTTAPVVPLDVRGQVVASMNVTAPAILPAGMVLEVIGADGGAANLTVHGFSGPPALQGWASRGTQAAPTAVQLNDQLVGLSAFAYGSTGYSTGPRASFACYAGGTWTDASQPTVCTLATTPASSIVLAERLRVTPDGNVGIGTSAPVTRLHVVTGANTTAISTGDGAVQTGIFNGAAGGVTAGWLGTDTNHPLAFYVNGSAPRLLVSTAGNVGIGALTPDTKLVVSANSDPLPSSAGAVTQLAAASGSATYVLAEAWQAHGGLIGRRAQGTPASPTAVSTDHQLVDLEGRGYDGTNYSSTQGSVSVFAAESWTPAAHGTFLSFGCTPLGTTALAECLRITGVSGGGGFRALLAPANAGPSFANSRPLTIDATMSGARTASAPFSFTEYVQPNTIAGFYVKNTDSSTAPTAQLGDRTSVTGMVHVIEQAGFTGSGIGFASVYQLEGSPANSERAAVAAYIDARGGTSYSLYGVNGWASARAGTTPASLYSGYFEVFCGAANCADVAAGVGIQHLETVGTSVAAHSALTIATAKSGGAAAASGFVNAITIGKHLLPSATTADLRITALGRLIWGAGAIPYLDYQDPTIGFAVKDSKDGFAIVSPGGAANGASMVLSHVGAAAARKYLRSFNGSLEVLNDAGAAVLWRLSDTGFMGLPQFAGGGNTIACIDNSGTVYRAVAGNC
jgi:hypothetical protein